MSVVADHTSVQAAGGADAAGRPPADDVIIELRDIHKSFGDKHVLKGISLSVEKGVSSVVMGGSGTGKSVLIKHVVRLLKPDQGQVWVMGKNLNAISSREVDETRLHTGYLFQGGALFDSMTVYENLDFLLERHSKMKRGERKDRIEETLEWVKLEHTAPSYPAELSGGQRKRIGLARSIVLQPAIMLYDEPTTGLDPVSVRTVSELILRLRDERGITSIAITHDLLCAEIIADDVHFLSKGTFVASGTLDEVRSSDHPEARNFYGA